MGQTQTETSIRLKPLADRVLVRRLAAEEKLKGGIISYGTEIEELMSNRIQTELKKYTTRSKVFRCTV